MIGFYLVKNDGSTIYIDASFIKKLLLNGGNMNITNSVEKIQVNSVFLAKINYIPAEIGESTLIDRIAEYLTSYNIDDFSILLTFNKAHLLALFYILYSGYGNIEDVYNIIHSTSYFTRRELLLNILSRDIASDTKVGLFGALKSNVSKMFSSKNYKEGIKRRDAAKKIILEGSFKIPNEYVKIPYGANLFAPNRDNSDGDVYFFENKRANEDAWSVSRYYYSLKIDQPIFGVSFKEAIISSDSVSWLSSKPYEIISLTLCGIALSLKKNPSRYKRYLYDMVLYEGILNPLVNKYSKGYIGEDPAFGPIDTIDPIYISKRNVIMSAISDSLLQLAAGDLINKDSYGVNSNDSSNQKYGPANQIMLSQLSASDFEKNIRDSFALYYSQSQYEYLPFAFEFEGDGISLNLHREDYKENVYSFYKSISAISEAASYTDDKLRIPVNGSLIRGTIENNPSLIDALVYTHNIVGTSNENELIRDLNSKKDASSETNSDYVAAVKYLSSFLSDFFGMHSNVSFSNTICRSETVDDKELDVDSILLPVKKRLLNKTDQDEEVDFQKPIETKASIPGGTSEEKELNLDTLLNFDILVDNESNILNFGTTKILAAITEIENTLTDNGEAFKIEVSELNNEKIQKLIIPKVLKFDITSSEYGVFVSYFAKVVMYKYLLYLINESLSVDDFSKSVMKLGTQSQEFIFYKALYMIRHCYLNISDVYNTYVGAPCLNSYDNSISINNPFGANDALDMIYNKIKAFSGTSKYSLKNMSLADFLALISGDIISSHIIIKSAFSDFEKTYFPISKAEEVISSMKCGVASFIKGDNNG